MLCKLFFPIHTCSGYIKKCKKFTKTNLYTSYKYIGESCTSSRFFLFLSPHFFISQFFKSQLGLKKEEKISYKRRIFSF
jgi:hypothetical protein